MSDSLREIGSDSNVFPSSVQGWPADIPNPQQSQPIQLSKRVRNVPGEEQGEDVIGFKVFVGGISWQASEVDLTQFFSSFGKVIDAKIIREASSGKSKGYGFVTFCDEASALTVKDIGFVELLGRKCQVGDAIRGVGRGGGPLLTPPSSPGGPSHQHPSPGARGGGPGGGKHQHQQSPQSGGGGGHHHNPYHQHQQQHHPHHHHPSSPGANQANAERSVFVGGLPRQADENALVYFFSQWGTVAEVKVIYDANNISKGFGFVTFAEAQTASLVKSYGTVEFMGRQMNVGDAVRGMSSGGRGRGHPSLGPLMPSPSHGPSGLGPPPPTGPHSQLGLGAAGHDPSQMSPYAQQHPPQFGPPMAMQSPPYGLGYPAGFASYTPVEYAPNLGYGIPGYNMPGYGGYGYGGGYTGMPGYPAGMSPGGFEGYVPPGYMGGAGVPGGGGGGGVPVTPPAPGAPQLSSAPLHQQQHQHQQQVSVTGTSASPTSSTPPDTSQAQPASTVHPTSTSPHPASQPHPTSDIEESSDVISQLLAKAHIGGTGSSSAAVALPATSTPPPVSLSGSSGLLAQTVVAVPPHVVSRVAGDRGALQLARITQQTGARVILLPGGVSSDSTNQHIEITGSGPQIQAAEQLVHSFFSSDEATPTS